MAGPKATQVWNFTIDDSSPIFHYEPFAEGPDPLNGWQFLANNDSISSQNISGLPSNATNHRTSMKGASVSIVFFGTSITLYGSATSPNSYSVTYDGESQKKIRTPGGVLFVSRRDTKRGSHNVTLTVTPQNSSEMLSFTGAILTSQVNSTQSIPGIIAQGSQDSMFKYKGRWESEEIHQSNPDSTAMMTTALGDLVSLNFATRAVAVYGPTNVSSGAYSVFINNTLHKFNASTTKPSRNTLLFYQDGLDRFRNCTMEITNLAEGKQLAISRVEFYNFDSGDVRSVNPSTPAKKDSSKKLHAGVIVAYTLVAVFTVLALLLVVLWMRRKRTRSFDRMWEVFRTHRLGSRLFRRKGMTVTPFRIDEESISSEKGSNNPNSTESNASPTPSLSPDRRLFRLPSQDQSTLERVLRMLARSMDPPTQSIEEPHESIRPPSYRGPL